MVLTWGDGACAHAHTCVHTQSHIPTCTHMLCIYIHMCTTHTRTHTYTHVYMHHTNVLMYTQMVKNLPAVQRTQVPSLGFGWEPPTGWMQVGLQWMEAGEAPASDHRTWGLKGCRVQDAGLCIPLFWPQLAPVQADGVATVQVSRGAGGPGLARTHRCLQHPQRPGIGLVDTPPPEPRAPLWPQFYQASSCV